MPGKNIYLKRRECIDLHLCSNKIFNKHSKAFTFSKAMIKKRLKNYHTYQWNLDPKGPCSQW